MRSSKIIVLAIILLLTACVTFDEKEHYHPKKLLPIQKIQLHFNPEKAVYSATTNTTFIKNGQNIHIFKNGKKLNIIGGLGFDNSQFNNLSDICIAPNGNLYTLDSFDKKIKKFDEKGKFITLLNLNDFSQPTLFDVSTNGDFYIYDADRNEISIFDSFNQTHTFGKFQIRKPSKLGVTQNFIILYSEKFNETIIFNKLGQFIEKVSGNLQMIYSQKYFLKKYFIHSQKNEEKLGVSHQEWKDFILKDNIAIQISSNKVNISRIIFQK